MDLASLIGLLGAIGMILGSLFAVQRKEMKQCGQILAHQEIEHLSTGSNKHPRRSTPGSIC